MELVGQPVIKLPEEYYTLDFETNGLPKGEDVSAVDIIEVAWTLSKDGVITKQFSKLANPGAPLPPKIIEVTGITDALLVGAVTPLEAAREGLTELIKSDLPIVGHNIIGFDRFFIDKYAKLLGLPKVDVERYIDTAALFKTFRRGHRAKTTAYELPKGSFFGWAVNVLERSWAVDAVKFNLDAAVGYLAVPQFGIETERHRALYDVILTSRVLEALRIEMGL